MKKEKTAVQNSKILKSLSMAFLNFDILTKTLETLKKCFIIFVVSFFKFIILAEVYKIFNGMFEFYTLVYLFISLFEIANGVALFISEFNLFFIFVAIGVSVCVFFYKKGNKENKTAKSYCGAFIAPSIKLNC